MAIQPHCVVCRAVEVAGSVEFADYQPGWQEPTDPQGVRIVGWSNELAVTAPPGVGLFCARHLRRARKLGHLSAVDAVSKLTAESSPESAWWSRMRRR